MKNKPLIFGMLSTIAFSAFALHALADTPEIKEYRGDIIDSHCYCAHKADLKAFLPTHTKECVLSPECREGGILLYQADGTVLNFDKRSEKRIGLFLEKKNSKLQVIIKAKKNPDNTYELISVMNQ